MKANHNKNVRMVGDDMTGQKFSQRTNWKQITTSQEFWPMNYWLDKNLVKEQNESKSQQTLYVAAEREQLDKNLVKEQNESKSQPNRDC